MAPVATTSFQQVDRALRDDRTVLMLGPGDVRRALSMSDAVEAMRTAFSALAEGRVQAPLRSAIASGDGTTLVMPGAINGPETGVAVKVVSVFPRNKELDLPAIHGLVLVVEPETGRPRAILDGGALTAIRTAAVCGLATDLLARPDSRVLTVIGSGVQARTQVEAVCTVRAIEEVRVVNPRLESAQAMAEDLADLSPIPPKVTATASVREALEGADVVCTATTAVEPFQTRWITGVSTVYIFLNRSE